MAEDALPHDNGILVTAHRRRHGDQSRADLAVEIGCGCSAAILGHFERGERYLAPRQAASGARVMDLEPGDLGGPMRMAELTALLGGEE